MFIALTPLGLLATGDAWGEWDAAGIEAQIKKVNGTGYVPHGIATEEEHGYKGLAGLTDYASAKGRAGYLGAALIGVIAIVLTLTLAGSALARREDRLEQLPEAVGDTGPRAQDSASAGADGPLPSWLSAPTPMVRIDGKGARGKPPNRYLARSITDLARRCSTALAGERWYAGT